MVDREIIREYCISIKVSAVIAAITAIALFFLVPPAEDAESCLIVSNYRVYRSSSPALSSFVVETTTSSTSYTVTSIPTGTWYFAVTAINCGSMESDISNTVGGYISDGTAPLSWATVTSCTDGSPATTPCSPPLPPTQLRASSSSLIWSQPVSRLNGSTIELFERNGALIYVSSAPGTSASYSYSYLATYPATSITLTYTASTITYNESGRTLYLPRGKHYMSIKEQDNDGQASSSSNEVHYWSAPAGEKTVKPGGVRRTK